MKALTARNVLGPPEESSVLATGAAGAVGGYAVALAHAEVHRVVALAFLTGEAALRAADADVFFLRGDDVVVDVLGLVDGGVDAMIGTSRLREQVEARLLPMRVRRPSPRPMSSTPTTASAKADCADGSSCSSARTNWSPSPPEAAAPGRSPAGRRAASGDGRQSAEIVTSVGPSSPRRTATASASSNAPSRTRPGAWPKSR
ncbi:hypothetical protein HDG68_001427 [Isoptericola chiayiensis]|nr:hypothetical protein [Isoptericola chiayiensis]NOW00538.1 hypothetical protein [Isoptericola chiayiensis]